MRRPPQDTQFLITSVFGRSSRRKAGADADPEIRRRRRRRRRRFVQLRGIYGIVTIVRTVTCAANCEPQPVIFMTEGDVRETCL